MGHGPVLISFIIFKLYIRLASHSTNQSNLHATNGAVIHFRIKREILAEAAEHIHKCHDIRSSCV